ncbi:proteasome-activating nucleotidase [Cercophora scortea]|uniref:Proteasome-activating nucleotidase n=1 Tax=Cercophora scortea TaxID=314031 RepID=A0AAE0IDT6_9PEZI|nr:proteasome-activating nucleotidase [Cercophora scortea]
MANLAATAMPDNAPPGVLSPSTAINHTAAYKSWLEYSTRWGREDIELNIYQLLLTTHPGYRVIRTSPYRCDLLGFAEAGHATATVANNTFMYEAVRNYESPEGGLHKEKSGTLEDELSFGKWLYTWDEREYIVYLFQYRNAQGSFGKSLYVLAKTGEGDEEVCSEGHHAAIDKLLIAAGDWTRELHDEINVFDSGWWKKDKDLFRAVQSTTWADVVLPAAIKDNLLADVLSFFDSRALYRDLSVPWKRGIILHGVPGNGKTASIKALMNSLAARQPDPVPSLYIKSLENCHGPQWAIHRIFATARRMAPCLLVFEDLDSIVGPKTRSYFLNEVDGLKSNDGILMVGSTNHLERLDAAITKRPSRFDRKYHFKVPDEASREAYARYWQNKLNSTAAAVAGTIEFAFPDEVCGLLARMTEGFSFAYLKELFVSSLLLLARGGQYESEEEENEENTKDDKTAPVPSEGSSSGDAVLVEHSDDTGKDTAAAASEGKDEKKKKDKKAKAAKPKPVFPTVPVPEHLGDNVLLRIFTAQAKLLFEQMDNTTDDGDDDGEDGAGKARRTILRHALVHDGACYCDDDDDSD